MEREGFDPYIAIERQRHNQAIPAAADEPAVSPATPKAKMRAKLRTESGRELYARRKTIVEPVFGQTAQQEPTKATHLLDLAEDRLDDRLPPRVQLTA